MMKEGDDADFFVGAPLVGSCRIVPNGYRTHEEAEDCRDAVC